MNFIEALEDKKLLAQFLGDDPSSWAAWKTFARCFFAVPPAGPDDLELFTKCTGRASWPTVPTREGWIVAGRRSGKSYFIALLAVFYAVFKKYRMSAGEVGYVAIVAPTKQQASLIRKYISGILSGNKMLNALIVKENASEIVLKNHVAISILSGDFRTLRGVTCICAIIDEVAFLGVEGVSPDLEVLRALRPTLATTGGPLICISSPYAKHGELYKAWKNHFGVDHSPVLVWQADSLTMNPTLSREAIAKAHADDPEGAASEWGAEFRGEAETFFPMDLLAECVKRGEGYHYFAEGGGADERYSSHDLSAFVDPAGGSGADSMVLAIAAVAPDGVRCVVHLDGRTPPFSPSEVTAEFCQTLKGYGISTVTGDKYGGAWIPEAFAAEGIEYLPADRNKSEIYLEMLALCNSGKVALPDNEKLIYQLGRLVRKHRSGRPSIDVPQHTSDDLANACAGALTSANAFQPFMGRAEDLLCGPRTPSRVERELDSTFGSSPRVRLSIQERMRTEFNF